MTGTGTAIKVAVLIREETARAVENTTIMIGMTEGKEAEVREMTIVISDTVTTVTLDAMTTVILDAVTMVIVDAIEMTPVNAVETEAKVQFPQTKECCPPPLQPQPQILSI